MSQAAERPPPGGLLFVEIKRRRRLEAVFDTTQWRWPALLTLRGSVKYLVLLNFQAEPIVISDATSPRRNYLSNRCCDRHGRMAMAVVLLRGFALRPIAQETALMDRFSFSNCPLDHSLRGPRRSQCCARIFDDGLFRGRTGPHRQHHSH